MATDKTDKELAQLASHEVTMRQSLKRHKEGCPEERLEISQTRKTQTGQISIVRCIDCGEQAVNVA